MHLIGSLKYCFSRAGTCAAPFTCLRVSFGKDDLVHNALIARSTAVLSEVAHMSQLTDRWTSQPQALTNTAAEHGKGIADLADGAHCPILGIVLLLAFALPRHFRVSVQDDLPNSIGNRRSSLNPCAIVKLCSPRNPLQSKCAVVP